jgi:hypothetical protein
MRPTSVILLALVTLTGAASAQAAPPPCTVTTLDAASADAQGILDTAVTSWRCLGASPSVHTARIVWQWWYYDDQYEFGTIPGCPTSAVPPATRQWVGATVVAGTAECRQPAGSPGFGQHRIVCADLVVDGEPLWGTSPFTNGACVDVNEV